MDPGAKRNLWDVISEVRDSGTSLVLTTHSMEECEAVCTRLAIMIRGEFKCIGSAQHLKNQFSKVFILTIKVRSAGAGLPELYHFRTDNFIQSNFPGAYLKLVLLLLSY